MWGLSLFTAIVLIALGVAIGIYIASQISEHVDSKSRHKELLKNLEEWDKKENQIKKIQEENKGKIIFESPDGGKTVYKREFGNYNKREKL